MRILNKVSRYNPYRDSENMFALSVAFIRNHNHKKTIYRREIKSTAILTIRMILDIFGIEAELSKICEDITYSLKPNRSKNKKRILFLLIFPIIFGDAVKV